MQIALADPESELKHFQVGEVTTITNAVYSTTDEGFSWSVVDNTWLYNGALTDMRQKTVKTEPEAKMVTLKCCSPGGAVISCLYEPC